MNSRFAVWGLCAAAGLLAACASPGKLPPDVGRFIERRDACDHFRGEVADPPDRGRMQELAEGFARFCTGTDNELAGLRQRYASDAGVMSRLSGYDEHVERSR